MATSSSGVICWSPAGRRIRTSGGRSSITRESTSVSRPSGDRRVSESDPIGIVARQHGRLRRRDRRSCAKRRAGRLPPQRGPARPSGRMRRACRCGRGREPSCPPDRRCRRRLVPHVAASWRGRILVTKIDPLDLCADERGHGVVRRAPRSRRDAILERSVDRFEHELKARAVRRHRDGAQLSSGLDGQARCEARQEPAARAHGCPDRQRLAHGHGHRREGPRRGSIEERS